MLPDILALVEVEELARVLLVISTAERCREIC